jgi:hypothetical protein
MGIDGLNEVDFGTLTAEHWAWLYDSYEPASDCFLVRKDPFVFNQVRSFAAGWGWVFAALRCPIANLQPYFTLHGPLSQKGHVNIDV